MSKHSRGAGFDMDSIFAAIGIKTSEVADTAKIKYEIHTIKKQRDNELYNIGAAVYKMYLKGRLDEKRLAEMCQTVVNMEKELETKNDEAEYVHKSAKRELKKTFEGKKDRDHNKHMKERPKYGFGESNSKSLVEVESYEVEPVE